MKCMRTFGLNGLGAYQRGLGHVAGYGTYTATGKVKAILSIGLKTGLDLGKRRTGARIAPRAALRAVMRERMQQVDPLAVGATVYGTTGYYRGSREPSMRVEVVWTPDQEKTPAGFARNIRKLAQQVAGELAQREVLVEWDAPRKRGCVESATPPGAPKPTSADFCAWVREHSKAARTDRSDSCFPHK